MPGVGVSGCGIEEPRILYQQAQAQHGPLLLPTAEGPRQVSLATHDGRRRGAVNSLSAKRRNPSTSSTSRPAGTSRWLTTTMRVLRVCGVSAAA